MPARSVAIANRHPRLRPDRRAIARAIHLLDTGFSKSTAPSKSKISACPPGELSLVFLTDAALAQLHAEFLDDPAPTDVITFGGDAAHGVAGEICVSVDAALRQVGLPLAGRPRSSPAPHPRRRRARLAAFSAELTLYVVHGWLHLAGYDDLQPAKKRAMRRAEARAMKILRDKEDCLSAFILR